MANYLDGMDGGKHNSDNTESIGVATSFTVSLTFECVTKKTPLKAAKDIAKWCKESADTMIFDVINEQTKEKFTVDLSEEDENAVLPNKDF
jgi:hypothetical protein